MSRIGTLLAASVLTLAPLGASAPASAGDPPTCAEATSSLLRIQADLDALVPLLNDVLTTVTPEAVLSLLDRTDVDESTRAAGRQVRTLQAKLDVAVGERAVACADTEDEVDHPRAAPETGGY